jgi:rod shape-determining protein MreD
MARQVRVWPVLVAFVAAIALDMMPLPELLQPARPPLPEMVLIYWVMMWPERFGVGTAFIIGLCLDILHGQLLGQNALSLSVVAYITLRFHLQIRIFPLWQLTMTIFALLAIGALVKFLIEGIAGLSMLGLARWGQVLAGVLLWPLLMGVMDRLRMQIEYRESTFD